MLTFVEILIGIVVIVGVARYIIKGYSATGVLFVGGLILLIVSALLGHKILPGNTAGTGYSATDIIEYIKILLMSRGGDLGMMIMMLCGFATYMTHIGANDMVVKLASKPLRYINSPYLLMIAAYFVACLMSLAVSSATGLGVLLMATLFLPQVVLNIPQFLMYRQFGWVDSPYYLALIVPTLFAQETYFVYMLIQFMRNIPRERDEAAKIDGCNIMQTLVLVLVPMLWPAMVSAGLFQFMWSSNDFMGPLLYVNSPARYPATLFVRMSMDADTGFAWNRVMAVSLISIIPSLVVFFLAQRQFMDGVTAGAVKG